MKKLSIIALSLVMAMMCLTACDGSASTPAPATTDPAAGSDEPVTLKFWYWADNAEQSVVMQNVIKGFNETNGKNITVIAEEYPWEGGGFFDAIFTAAMGGGGPDISMFRLNAGPLFAANGLLQDLSPYLDSWEDRSQLPDSLWSVMKQATNDGTVSLMPFSVETLFYYYRPSYFEMAGVSVPTTFDGLLDAIEKCTMDTDGDGKIDVYGFGLRGSTGGQEHLGNFMYAYGGSWDDMTAPGSVQGYQKYLDIYKKGFAPESAVNAAYAEMIDGFKSGLTAIIMHHIVSSSMWVETFGDDVDAFVSPPGPGGQWTAMGETETVMYKRCNNPDAAFEFMKYMTTGQGGTDWYVGSGKGLPVTMGVQATDEYKNNRFMKYAADSLEIAGILPLTETATEFINTTYPNTNQQALLGQITAEDACKIMNASLNGK